LPQTAAHRLAASREVLPDAPAAPAGKPLAPRAALPVHAAKPLKSAKPAPVEPAPAKPVPLPASEPRALQPAARKQPKPVAASNPTPKKAEALFTTLPDAKALFDRKSAIFVDARHAEDYSVEHIPGAVSLFAEDLDARYEAVFHGIPKDRTIVTYCSDPQCEMAAKLADALVARGHTKVFILLEGLPGWKNAGYPTISGSAS
jgi:rhodanese-related sulfurtransferase